MSGRKTHPLDVILEGMQWLGLNHDSITITENQYDDDDLPYGKSLVVRGEVSGVSITGTDLAGALALMEEAVKARFPKHCIVRLGLATWGTNPHTMINKIKGQIARGEPYEVHPVDDAAFRRRRCEQR